MVLIDKVTYSPGTMIINSTTFIILRPIQELKNSIERKIFTR